MGHAPDCVMGITSGQIVKLLARVSMVLASTQLIMTRISAPVHPVVAGGLGSIAIRLAPVNMGPVMTDYRALVFAPLVPMDITEWIVTWLVSVSMDHAATGLGVMEVALVMILTMALIVTRFAFVQMDFVIKLQ